MTTIAEKLLRILNGNRHLTSAMSDQMMVSAINFITGILLARILGIEEFGRFTLIWSLYLFAYALQGGLLINPMMSISPKLDDVEQRSYFSAIFIQSAVYSIGAALLIAGIMGVGNHFGLDTSEYALPMYIAVAFRLLQDIFRRYLFATGKAKQALAHDAACYLGQLALISLLALRDSISLGEVIYAHAIPAVWAIAISAGNSGKLITDTRSTWTWTRRNWTSSRWLTLSEIAEWTSNYAFLAVAGMFIGNAFVGAIRAGQNLMGLANILLLGLENVFPAQAATRYAHGGATNLKPYIRKAAYLITGFMLVVILFTAPLAKFWMNLFYGQEYVGYSEVIFWLGITNLLAAASIPFRVTLRTLEKTRPVFVTFFTTAVLTLLFAPALTWSIGSTGILAGMLTIAGIRLYLFYAYTAAAHN